MKEKAISYAYASSISASRLGFRNAGCYVVEIGEPTKMKAVSGHATKKEAISACAKINLPVSKYSL